MKANRLVKLVVTVLLLASLCVGGLAGPVPVQAADPPKDWDIQGGHFFSQTGKGQNSGFSITDDNGVAFWSEFQRLGGVNGAGYPVSRRFEWNGFTCQAMQKIVFQWRPDARQVSFVNVFDLAHEQGKDAWLKTVRQTPEPKQWQEAGLPWDQVVKGRLAVMDNFPAIEQAYLGVGGDPVTMNGLPTTDVVDMGNNYVLRAQRVVIQQWKEDVPWAKKGQVTFGLGGAIAVEAGLLPVATAGDAELVYQDKERHFQALHPYNWTYTANKAEGWTGGFFASYVEEGLYRPGLAFDTGTDEVTYSPEQIASIWSSDAYKKEFGSEISVDNLAIGNATVVRFGERVIVKQGYSGTGRESGLKLRAMRYSFYVDKNYYYFCGVAPESSWSRNEGIFDWIASSLQPLP